MKTRVLCHIGTENLKWGGGEPLTGMGYNFLKAEIKLQMTILEA